MSSQRARDFAIKAHGDQKYSGAPYVVHLDAVAAVIAEFGFQFKALRDAAYLHDVLEDTQVKWWDIRREFGNDVALLVMSVTDEPGKDRAERKRRTYPKIASSRLAVVLKLADRIANVRASVGTRYFRMYRDEYAEFRAALFRCGDPCGDMYWRPMWMEMDRLMEYVA